MIYGLYLSASGVMANSMRQDVIANNIANAETTGFKRDLSVITQRPTEAQLRAGRANSAQTDPDLEGIGGGILFSRMQIDDSQGEFQPTGNPMDAAIQGSGYFAVSNNGQTRLTRNGQFLVDRSGKLVLATDTGQSVLSDKQTPIQLKPNIPATISSDGSILQNGETVAQLGLFNVSDPTRLKKMGATLLAYPSDQTLSTATPTVHGGAIERSNVDPAEELTSLMDTQRQLEANANMIQYQDETLDKLVNDVGRVT